MEIDDDENSDGSDCVPVKEIPKDGYTEAIDIVNTLNKCQSNIHCLACRYSQKLNRKTKGTNVPHKLL